MTLDAWLTVGILLLTFVALLATRFPVLETLKINFESRK